MDCQLPGGGWQRHGMEKVHGTVTAWNSQYQEKERNICMKKRVIMWSLAVLMLLPGCAARTEAEADAFFIECRNDTAEEIALISIAYGGGGDIWGECGACNADGRSLRAGESFRFAFQTLDFPREADLSRFTMEIFLNDGEKMEHPVKNRLKFPAEYGKTYWISLTGSAGDGYFAVRNFR